MAESDSLATLTKVIRNNKKTILPSFSVCLDLPHVYPERLLALSARQLGFLHLKLGAKKAVQYVVVHVVRFVHLWRLNAEAARVRGIFDLGYKRRVVSL